MIELFEFMAVAPVNTNMLLAKIDLSDGFWCMIVKPKHHYNFCYIRLQWQGEPTGMVLLSVLQVSQTTTPGRRLVCDL